MKRTQKSNTEATDIQICIDCPECGSLARLETNDNGDLWYRCINPEYYHLINVW